jgi:predicted membrane protein DUF2231
VFDSIGNLPLHPLVIHAVVIGIPLCLLLAVLFAWPVTRSWARWPLAVVAVGTLATAFVARESGEALRAALRIDPTNAPEVSGLIDRHATLATQLVLIMAAFAVVAVANVFLVRRRGATGRTLISVVLPLVLVAIGAVALFWCYQVGDIGSRAVWNPTGAVKYTVSQGR